MTSAPGSFHHTLEPMTIGHSFCGILSVTIVLPYTHNPSPAPLTSILILCKAPHRQVHAWLLLTLKLFHLWNPYTLGFLSDQSQLPFQFFNFLVGQNLLLIFPVFSVPWTPPTDPVPLLPFPLHLPLHPAGQPFSKMHREMPEISGFQKSLTLCSKFSGLYLNEKNKDNRGTF